VSYEDFKRVFQFPDEDLETRGAGTSESNFESVPPKPIPELVDIQRVRSFYQCYKFHNHSTYT
jgi:hypothetical protein